MKMLKKNQIIIYVIALMLVTAGYLNYTTNNETATIQTGGSEEELMEMANIGDAQLVSSNELLSENNTTENAISNAITTNEMSSLGSQDSTTNTVNNTVETSANNTTSDVDYFATSKLERDKMYSQMIETYEKILNSNNSSETQKQSATEEITKINNTKNSIMICENLFKTKGFENCVIFVNGSSISVIIGKESLSKEEVAQIQNIITREMNAKAENIHISNK